MNTVQKTVTSKDGTTIAFEQSGKGRVIILVASALSDRSDTTKLAGLLAEHFTVINYDRRGRGQSGDTRPYAVARELEDLESLIDGAGSTAVVFGSSSGAVLALDAANKLGCKIEKLCLYEPPLIVNGGRPPMQTDLLRQINDLVAAGRRNDAVKRFMSQAMGIPALGIFVMRFMPGWSKMTSMAHTLVYDLSILEELQAGKPLPEGRWSSVMAPTLVLTGEKSEPFFHEGAQALTNRLPNARHRILKGQHHGSVVTAPKVLAAELMEFVQLEGSPQRSDR